MDVDVDDTVVIGEYQAYVKVYVIRNDSIPWKMTATVNGEVVWVEEVEFVVDDDDAARRLISTGSRSSTITTTVEPISDVFTVMLDEYIDSSSCSNTAPESITVARRNGYVKGKEGYEG